MSKPVFCNYCKCNDCVNGRSDLTHAYTDRGDYICDVCYTYDLWDANHDDIPFGCDGKECGHRPTLVSEFK